MPGAGQTNIWQSFTAGRTGLLSKVSMEFYQPTASGTLYIYSGQGTGGSLLTSQSFSISSPNNDYSFMDFTLGSNSKTLADFLGSNPGFSSSLIMSFKPNIPIS